MLDGSESIPGIDIDTDLRWLILGQLSEEGHADVALIQATMASDPSDIGRRRGTACLAARPTAAAKEEAWERVAEPNAPMPAAWKGATDGELSVASMSAILRGFYIGSVGVGGLMAHGPDPELLRPYVQRYLDALPAMWAERTIDEAEAFTECLYPSHLVDDQVVAAIDFALESGELPGSRRADPARGPRQHAPCAARPRSGPSRRRLAGRAAHLSERFVVLVAAGASGWLATDADPVVDRREAVDRAQPGESAGATPRLLAHLGSANGVVKDIGDCPRIVLGLVALDEVAGDPVLHDLAQTADGSSDDRGSERLRLERHEAEALGQ